MVKTMIKNAPATGMRDDMGGGRLWRDAELLLNDVRPVLARLLAGGVMGLEGAHPYARKIDRLFTGYIGDGAADVQGFLDHYANQIKQRTQKGADFYRSVERFFLVAFVSVCDPHRANFELSPIEQTNEVADAEVMLNIGWDLAGNANTATQKGLAQ